MAKGMSVKERLSLEFVSASGASAYSGAKRESNIGLLPELSLLEIEREPGSKAAADQAVDDLKVLFDSVRPNS